MLSAFQGSVREEYGIDECLIPVETPHVLRPRFGAGLTSMRYRARACLLCDACGGNPTPRMLNHLVTFRILG